jgi:flagellin-specific chaperone FliS
MNQEQTQIITAVISALGGITVAIVAVAFKDRVVAKRQPKDRMETIFDGYENLIRQQQLDIQRKEEQLVRTQTIIERLQAELDTTRIIVAKQQAELDLSKSTNEELVEQLSQMKKHYMSSRIEQERKDQDAQ